MWAPVPRGNISGLLKVHRTPALVPESELTRDDPHADAAVISYGPRRVPGVSSMASKLEGYRAESQQIRQIGSRVRLGSLEVEHSSLPILTDVIAVPSLLPHLIKQLVHP